VFTILLNRNSVTSDWEPASRITLSLTPSNRGSLPFQICLSKKLSASVMIFERSTTYEIPKNPQTTDLNVKKKWMCISL